MRASMEVLFLPFLAILEGPLFLLHRTLARFFAFGALGAFLMFLYTHTFGDFAGIWMCGAASLLLKRLHSHGRWSN